MMRSHPTYELLEAIGKGASATVYRARDLSLQRDVAVKVLHDKFKQDQQQMQQFWQEAQFLANLNHDNIVQIYALEKDRGWIVMELMEGSLDAKIDEGPLPPDLVRSILQQCLEALKVLHGQNKLHGAIRPGNLLINDQGRVKLSDSAGIPLGGVFRKPAGSAKYLAPELLKPDFGDVSVAVDLYCLGFTALELLKGPSFDALFKGVGPDAIDPELAWLRWHSSPDQLPPVSEILPRIPPDLARVIDKLLAKNLSDRYQSAEEALRDLEDKPIVLVEPPRSSAKSKRPAEKAEPKWKAAAPPPGKPAKEPKQADKSPKSAPAKKQGTRDWLNEKLSKPYILYPLLALIIIPTLIFFFWEEDETKPRPEPGPQPEPVAVHIRTVPPGATILVNGKEQKQKSNAELRLKPGKYDVALTLKNHKKYTEKVEIAKDSAPLTLTHKFVPLDLLQKITIKTIPSGAKVVLDEEPQEKLTDGEYYVSPGKIKVRLEKKYYQTHEETKEVKKGENPPFIFALKRIEKTVAINTDPPGAKVVIDNQPQTTLTNGKFQVPLGPLEIEFYKQYFHPLKKMVVVEEDDDALPTFSLKPILKELSVSIKTADGKPADAKVFIDGKLAKPLPNGKYEVPAGPHEIKVDAGEKYKATKPQSILVKEDEDNPKFVIPLELNTRPLTIVIKGDVQKAKIFIDEKPTPLTKDGSYQVSPGKHEVKVEIGEESKKQTAMVKPEGELPPLIFDFNPPTEAVSITTVPAGGKIKIDGKPAKKLPDGKYQVEVGQHQVEITYDKYYEPLKKSMTVKKGEENKFVFTLKKVTKILAVNSIPNEADIYIDQQLMKDKTSAKFKLLPGKHTVVIKHDGYEPYSKEIIVALAQDPDPINAQLIPLVAQKYAFIAGVNRPTDALPDFLHAEADATALARTLIAGGWNEDNVVVITQTANKPLIPSKILAELQKLTGKCKQTDTLLVAFVGHQIQLVGPNEVYFLPPGAQLKDKTTLLSMDEVYKELDDCQASAKFIIRDGWRQEWHSKTPPLQGVKINRLRPAKKAPAGMVLLSSCQPGNLGYPHDYYRRGVLFHFLLRALQGDADGNNDQHITIKEVGEYLQTHMPKYTMKEYGMAQKAELDGNQKLFDRKLTFIDQALATFGRGRTLLEQKKYDGAISAFTLASKALPNFLDLYLYRAEAHYYQNDYKAALKDAEAALKLDEYNATAHSYKGDSLNQLEQYQAAMKSHNKAIQFEPEYAYEYNLRGHVFLGLKEKQKALDDYTTAITLNPKYSEAYNNRGNIYLGQKKLVNAINDYTAAIQHDPMNADYYHNRALAYHLNGEFPSAIADLTLAVKFASSDKDKAVFLYKRGNTHMATKRIAEAIKDFSESVAKDPGYVKSWYYRGYCYQTQRDYAKAIDDYSKVISLDKNHAIAWNLRGECIEKSTQNYDEAIKSYSQAVDIALKNKAEYGATLRFFLLNRGKAYYRKGKDALNAGLPSAKASFNAAVKDFTSVIQNDPTDAEAYEARAMAYTALGDRAKAAADQQAAKQIRNKQRKFDL